MPRKQKTIHYIYKTTCVVTGRYYIGMHSTDSLEDGYMGSGKRLRYSIRKYGKKSHVKEILEFCESRELLVEREKEIVNTDLLVDKLCMNIMSGGTGGFISEEQQRYRSSCGGTKLHQKLKNDEEFKKLWKERLVNGLKKAVKEGRLKPNFAGWNKGKSLSENHKKLIGERNKIKQKGRLNSQYGTCWIMKDGVNKKIKKEELEFYINNNWIKGRI